MSHFLRGYFLKLHKFLLWLQSRTKKLLNNKIGDRTLRKLSEWTINVNNKFELYDNNIRSEFHIGFAANEQFSALLEPESILSMNWTLYFTQVYSKYIYVYLYICISGAAIVVVFNRWTVYSYGAEVQNSMYLNISEVLD